jgi:hypothetical protein
MNRACFNQNTNLHESASWRTSCIRTIKNNFVRMKTKLNLIVLLIITISWSYVNGQDVIVMKNGDEIKSKVLEINTYDIKYKKFDNLEGPIISISKSNVSIIKYQNGTQDVINAPSNSTNTTSAANTESNKQKKHSDSKPNRLGIYINPLGLVQFGPMAGLELTLASRLIIDAHARIAPLGLLNYATNSDDEEGWPDQLTGMAIGGGIKYLAPSRIGGFYIGILLEDGWQKQYYAKDETWTWVTESNYIVFAPNLGYKFRSHSGFFLNTGLIFGAAVTGKDQWHYTKNYKSDHSIHDNGSQVHPFGMVELGIGVEF